MEKQLPSNLDAERATLGSILMDRDAIIAIAAWLAPEHFYLEKHRWVYEAMTACYTRRVPPDLQTVADELRRAERLAEIGDLAFLVDLANSVPTSYHVEYYARTVERTAVLRRLIQAGGKIAALGYDETDELEQTLDQAEQELFSVSQRKGMQGFMPLSQIVDQYYEYLNDVQERGPEMSGLPTHFVDFDRLTGGLHKSDLLILAARPGVGKSSFAMSIAYNVAMLNNGAVGIFSLEMGRDQLLQRLLATSTGIDSQKLRTGKISNQELQTIMDAMGHFSAAPIHIDDTPSITVNEVRSKARRLQAESGLDMLIVDYLQLMSGSGRRNDNRVQEVAEISRSLKGLARELNVPVLALSQLSRAVEGRTSHVPMLSDLRESGCLTGDTPIYLPDLGVYRPIKELVQPEAGTQQDSRILALNTETWQLEPRNVVNAFSTGTKPIYRLRTRLGRTVRATANHKFLTIDGWLRLDELSSGTRIALPRHLPGPIQATMSDAEPCQAQASPAINRRAKEQRPMNGADHPSPIHGALLFSPVSSAPGLLAESAVYWDEVVEIQYDGEEEVYDLTVEGLHNFVAGNIVVHNSIEQDADMVMFIYREEMYDKDTDKKGIAEIHIAKHRNGPLGVINLFFDQRTTRFRDLAPYQSPQGY